MSIREIRIFGDADLLVEYCRERFEVELPRPHAIQLAKFGKLFVGHDSTAACMIWISRRLNELGLFPCGGLSEEGIRVECLMHVFDLHGSQPVARFSPRELRDETGHLGVRRSPLSRIIDAEPVDRTAWRLVGQSVHSSEDGFTRFACPYCNYKGIRNPAAMVVHLKQRHDDKLLQEVM